MRALPAPPAAPTPRRGPGRGLRGRSVAVLLLLAWLGAGLAGAAGATTGDEQAPATGGDGSVVEILPLSGYLDPPSATAIERVLEDAAAGDVELVVLQLALDAVVSVDTADLARRIDESPVPVAVFVGPGGTGAPLAGGALELLAAADVRAAAIDARLGPLVPLDVGDDLTPELAAAAVTRVAERWPEGAAVLAADPAGTVVVGEGGTLEDPTAAELALDLVVPSPDVLLFELDGTEVTTAAGTRALDLEPSQVSVRLQSLSLSGRLLHASTSPAFVYLLLVIGLGMLLFEWFQPGFGVAGAAGLVAVALAVAGLAVFPVAWWAVALVVLGLVLYAVDTAVAGFGPLTALATAATAAGSWWFYDSQAIAVGGVLTALTTLTALVFFVVGMTVILRAQAGPVDVSVDDLVGRAGIVRSVLNPEGHVYVDGALWRARWTGQGRRAKVGTPVRVHGTDGALVLVEPFEPGGASGPATDGTPRTTATAPAQPPAGRSQTTDDPDAGAAP